MHQIQLRLGLRSSAPDPARRIYSTPPDPLAGFKGRTSRKEGKGKRGQGGEKVVRRAPKLLLNHVHSEPRYATEYQPIWYVRELRINDTSIPNKALQYCGHQYTYRRTAAKNNPGKKCKKIWRRSQLLICHMSVMTDGLYLKELLPHWISSGYGAGLISPHYMATAGWFNTGSVLMVLPVTLKQWNAIAFLLVNVIRTRASSTTFWRR